MAESILTAVFFFSLFGISVSLNRYVFPNLNGVGISNLMGNSDLTVCKYAIHNASRFKAAFSESDREHFITTRRSLVRENTRLRPIHFMSQRWLKPVFLQKSSQRIDETLLIFSSFKNGPVISSGSEPNASAAARCEGPTQSLTICLRRSIDFPARSRSSQADARKRRVFAAFLYKK